MGAHSRVRFRMLVFFTIQLAWAFVNGAPMPPEGSAEVSGPDCSNPEPGMSVCQCLTNMYRHSEFPWLPTPGAGIVVELVELPFVMPDGNSTTRCFFYMMKSDGHDEAKSSKLRPVLFSWHGSGGDASQQYYMSHSIFGAPNSSLWNDDRLIVVFPQGTETVSIPGASFNAGGWCCASAAQTGIDDVKFADQIVDYVLNNITVDVGQDSPKRVADPARIYSTGVSNGCFMTQRLLTERPNTFAAGACAAGYNAVASLEFEEGPGFYSSPWGPVLAPILHGFPPDYGSPNYTGHYPSLMLAHGTADAIINYYNLHFGGTALNLAPSSPINSLQGWGNIPNVLNAVSANDNVQIWAYANGCEEEYVPAEEQASYGELYATKQQFTCNQSSSQSVRGTDHTSELVFLKLHGAGHLGILAYSEFAPGYVDYMVFGEGSGRLPLLKMSVAKSGPSTGANLLTGKSLLRTPRQCGPQQSGYPELMYGGWACFEVLPKFWSFLKDKECVGCNLPQ